MTLYPASGGNGRYRSGTPAGHTCLPTGAEPMPDRHSQRNSKTTSFSVGIEESPATGTRVHALDLLGCAAEGASPQEALDAFAASLAAWLQLLGAAGEPIPPVGIELDITVDEWVRTDVDVLAGESDACFEADLRGLEDSEIEAGLRRFGDLRGRLLSVVRGAPRDLLDAPSASGMSTNRILDELARAEWWTLSRLGASPLAEVPDRILGRLDTAAALIVDRFTRLSPDIRGTLLEIDGECWTPRKVLRRLLWLEWTLGRTIRHRFGTPDRPQESGP